MPVMQSFIFFTEEDRDAYFLGILLMLPILIFSFVIRTKWFIKWLINFIEKINNILGTKANYFLIVLYTPILFLIVKGLYVFFTHTLPLLWSAL
jgi:hypothetical protein